MIISKKCYKFLIETVCSEITREHYEDLLEHATQKIILKNAFLIIKQSTNEVESPYYRGYINDGDKYYRTVMYASNKEQFIKLFS